MSLPQSIHPAELTGDHLGALVRWERGEVSHQGRLIAIEHGFDLTDDEGWTPVISSRALPSTRFTIKGVAPIVAPAVAEARLTILEERA